MTTILEQLANELAVMRGQKATGTSVGPYIHGPGGLFGVSGLERDVFTAYVDAHGLASALPVFMSNKTNPLIGYITGFQASSGDQPDPDSEPCGRFPTAGAIKGCIQTAQFGQYGFETRELKLNRLGQVIDAGETTDLRIVNSPLVEPLGRMLMPSLPDQQILMLGREVMSRLLEVGIDFQRELSQQLYNGTGLTNEFPGLNTLIGTNKVDAITGTTCDALDSDVKDFNYSCIGDSDAANDIVRVLTTMMRYLMHNASSMHFGQVEWAIVMNSNLFTEITDVWPCAYNTYRCQMGFEAENGRVFVDGNVQRMMSDEMRNGKYLKIDGRNIRVIIDDYIDEESAGTPGANLVAGQFASDIYVIPLTIRGGTPATYWEFFDYRVGLMPAIQQGRLNAEFWTDGGRYSWNWESVRRCVTWDAMCEPRIRLDVPHLAGRLQNVCYEPLQHFRDPVPDDYYFVNGGITTDRAAPSYWSDWNLPD